MNIASIVTRVLGTTAAIAAISLCPLSARAGTVYSNNFPVGTTNTALSGLNTLATGFTTGTNVADLTIASIDLALAVSGTNDSATPVVQIFDGVANPTTLVATLSGAAVTNALPPQAYTFTPSSPFTLTANTNYWIVAATSVGEMGWYYSDNSPSAQNGSGYQFIGAKTSANGGTTYSNNFPAGAAYVSIQSVPEPSTLVLAGAGIATAVTLDTVRRRRRKAAADSIGFEG